MEFIWTVKKGEGAKDITKINLRNFDARVEKGFELRKNRMKVS